MSKRKDCGVVERKGSLVWVTERKGTMGLVAHAMRKMKRVGLLEYHALINEGVVVE